MKIFHSGGRIGDLIFQLWTVKKLGGGILYVSDYHHPNWDLGYVENMRLLLEAQPYIDAVVPVSYVAMVSAGQHIDYDLQKAEEGPNGVTHIAERYARFFDLDYDGVPWLEVEEEKMARVVWHIPMRRSVRSEDDWRDIMNRIPATQIIFGQEPLHGIDDWDMLRIAQVIKGASVFAGTVSFCNCIAEAVGTPNLVEQAPDCHNIRPTVSLNGKSNDAVVKLIKDRVWTH